MDIIHHRCNSIDKLISVNTDLGVEVDVRSFGERLILNHDPYKDSQSFDDWLSNFKHKILILNVKEEGLEERILKLMIKHSIENFFFLDQSFPFLMKTILRGESRTSIRISEYESIETALKLSGKVNWIWIDFFNCLPIDYESYFKLKEGGFKLCLVSPELQGHPISKIYDLKKELNLKKIILDAVCTKKPNLWKD